MTMSNFFTGKIAFRLSRIRDGCLLKNSGEAEKKIVEKKVISLQSEEHLAPFIYLLLLNYLVRISIFLYCIYFLYSGC